MADDKPLLTDDEFQEVWEAFHSKAKKCEAPRKALEHIQHDYPDIKLDGLLLNSKRANAKYVEVDRDVFFEILKQVV